MALFNDDIPAEPDLDDLIRRADAAGEEFAETGDVEAATLAVQLWEQISLLVPSDPDLVGELGGALLERFGVLGDGDDLDYALRVYRQADVITSHGDPYVLNNLGNCLRTSYAHTDVRSLLEEAGEVLTLAAELALDDDDDDLVPTVLDNLGLVHFERYLIDHDTTHLESSLAAHHQAVSRGRPQDSNRPLHLTNLGTALQELFDLTGEAGHMTEAINAYRQAIDLTERRSPDLPLRLANLSGSLLARHRRLGDLSDLTEAVSSAERALALSPSTAADRGRQMHTLAQALVTRYEEHGDPDDLARGLRLYDREGLSQHARIGYVNALLAQYERSGDQRELRLAIQAGEGAFHAGHEQSIIGPTGTATLALCLMEQFGVDGSRHALDRAIELLEFAVDAVAPRSPACADQQGNLAVALIERWHIVGDDRDLERAQALFDSAVTRNGSLPPTMGDRNNQALARLSRSRMTGQRREELTDVIQRFTELVTPGGEQRTGPRRGRYLGNLAEALNDRYNLTGDLHDLQKAIAARRAQIAASAHFGGASSMRRDAFQGLADALLSRFDRSGVDADLDEAVSRLAEAVEATPPQSPHRAGVVNDWGNALRVRYRHLNQISDLETALSAFDDLVLRTPPTAPDLPVYLDNLANALVNRYERTQDPGDLDRALDTYAEALDAMPARSSDRARVIANHAGAVWFRWRRDGADADLDHAIDLIRSALNLLPPTSPSRPVYLNSAGCFLRDRHTRSDARADLREATEAFRTACREGALTDALWALEAARNWGRWAMARQAAPDAVEAYDHALAALRQVFTSQLLRAHKENWLRVAGQLAAEAAAAKVMAGDLAQAVLALDSGRAALLDEALQRHRLEPLSSQRSDLVARFAAASTTIATLSGSTGRPPIERPPGQFP